MALGDVAGRRGGALLLERERELAEVRQLLERAASGTGAVLVVEGPAGIGKTSLVREASSLARARGFWALTARGSELERDFAFGVARQLLEPRLAAASTRERTALFDGAAGLARLALEVDASRPDEAGDASADDRSFPVLHGLYWLCANLAALGPLLVSLDDAHWADAPSLRFLAYLARRLEEHPILLLVAVRPSEIGAESAALSEVLGDPLMRRLPLAPLSADAVGALVRRLLTAEPDEAFCRACHVATAGNPFFVSELLASLRAEGVAPTAAAASHAEELGARAASRAVLLRLSRLPSAAGTLARAVAVLGDGAEHRHAVGLAGLDEGAAAEAEAALRRAGFFDTGAPFRFAHPVVRAAIYDELPLAERSRAHLAAARALSGEEAPAEKVAAHLLAVEPAADPWVVDTLREAARHALWRGAADVAATYLHRAVAEPPAPPDRAATLRELGSAERRTGEPAAIEHLERASALADEPQTHALAARELAGALMMSRRVPEGVAVLQGAIARVAEAEAELRLRLEADLIAMARTQRSTWPVAEERLERLRGRVEGRSPIERLLLVSFAHAAGRAGEPAGDAADLAERALAGGRLLNEQTPDSHQFYMAVYVLMAADRLDVAEAMLDQALADAQARGSALGFAFASCYRSRLAYRRGAIMDAEAEARSSLDVAPHTWLGVPIALANLIDALIERGAYDEAEQALEERKIPDDVPENTAFDALLASRGRLRLAEGETRRALAEFAELSRREQEWRPMHPAATVYRSDTALALLALGNRDEAQLLAEEAVASARRWGAASFLGGGLRVLGVVEGGRRGLAHLHEAVGLLEASPAALELARALVDLGVALRHADERSAAREPLRRGLDLAQRCGAKVLVERARQELVVAGGRPRRLLISGIDALTASERRVAQLAAGGLSNREIAQALFVTTRTIEVHLTHAYRKLGIRSRQELPHVLATPCNAEVGEAVPLATA